MVIRNYFLTFAKQKSSNLNRMKRLFKGMWAVLFSLGTFSCVIDSVYPMHIINNTNDTILIGYGHNNIIDSTKWFMYSDTGDSLAFKLGYVMTRFNGKEKLSIGEHDLIPPDSSAGYHEPHPLFLDWPNQTGYFFVIKLETARRHTWEEICRDTLYDAIAITQDLLKQGNRFDYWGEDRKLESP